MRLSVVMPVYNERWTIREIVRRVLAQGDLVHELVIVDDGSTDGTRERIAELVKKHAGGKVRLRAVYKDRNEGKGRALRDGFAAAEGEIILVQDADLEYDPADYARLIEPIRDGQAEAVYGSRFTGDRKRALLFWHMLANRLLTLLCNAAANLNLTDVWTGYKAFRAEVIKKIPIESRGFEFEPEITIKLSQLGCRIYEVPIRYHGRTYAEGKKIGFWDAVTGTWAMARTALAGDLGELAVGERTLRVMAAAGRYNSWLYERFRTYLGVSVVEIGSGVGNFSHFLLDRERVVLTDADPAYVEALGSAYRGWGYVEVKRLALGGGSAEGDLKGAFDSAVALNVIEHIEGDAAAVASVGRLLKPGGYAVFIVPAHQALYGSMDKALGHVRRYDLKGFGALLADAGLEAVELRYLNPLAVPGWYFNGRVLRRRIIPRLQLSLFDRLVWLLSPLERLGLPFGLSVFAVARRPAAAGHGR